MVAFAKVSHIQSKVLYDMQIKTQSEILLSYSISFNLTSFTTVTFIMKILLLFLQQISSIVCTSFFSMDMFWMQWPVWDFGKHCRCSWPCRTTVLTFFFNELNCLKQRTAHKDLFGGLTLPYFCWKNIMIFNPAHGPKTPHS